MHLAIEITPWRGRCESSFFPEIRQAIEEIDNWGLPRIAVDVSQFNIRKMPAACSVVLVVAPLVAHRPLLRKGYAADGQGR